MAQNYQAGCQAGDLKGNWATEPVGTILGGELAGPFTAVGLLTFDGVGTFSGVASSSFDGAIVYPFPAAGPYTVSSDCFVHVVETSLNIIFDGYLTRDKDEIVFFEPQAGTITTNLLRRIKIPYCNERSLQDNWAIQATGTIVGTGQFAQNGRLKFDGRGKFTGTTASSIAGSIVDQDITGTYTMNSDCTFTGTVRGGITGGGYIFGILFHYGEGFYFDYSAAAPASFLPTGLVISGTGRQAAPAEPPF
jgi:hypothetical protein